MCALRGWLVCAVTHVAMSVTWPSATCRGHCSLTTCRDWGGEGVHGHGRGGFEKVVVVSQKMVEYLEGGGRRVSGAG